VGILFVLRRDRKNGKSSCGGNCGHCPMGGTCHKS
ncbi:MAG: FeoB-associated Cys-rich membrane protein, partial [Clostridia bacterium]|nr:FeoB-associated Cys-rich membrane protein [Clostridia bacterium]